MPAVATGIFYIMALAGESNPERIRLNNHLLRRCDYCLSKRAPSFLYNESVQAVINTRKDGALWPIV